MINPGFKIKATDVQTIREFRKSAAYSTYLRSIANSPAFNILIKECMGNVNITNDLEKLREQKRLPENTSIEALNEIFVHSLQRLAIGIMADTVILRELEELNVDEVLHDIKEDASTLYVMGLADKKYYQQAATLLEDGKLEPNSVECRGLMAYMKRNGSPGTFDIKEPESEPETNKEPEHKKKESKRKIDIQNDSIRL
jgi:hypothetical protein